MFKPKKSPNFNDRRDGAKPSMLILHYTGMETAEAALERLCDPAAEVSAHYFIDESGKVIELVDPEKRAWHAGVAYWGGITDINSHSIGIEIVNPGHEFGYHAFPEKQIAAVIKESKRLVEQYGISPDNVLGHSDIAPSRKEDPGELFPWPVLAEAGIGLWPAPQEMDYQAAEDVLLNQGSFHELLCGYGYNPEEDISAVITAFHRHFYPEKFAAGQKPDEPDVLSVAKLLSLIRQRHDAKT